MTIANVWSQFWMTFIHKLIYTLVCFYILLNQQGFFFPCLNLASLSKMFLKWLKAFLIWVFLSRQFFRINFLNRQISLLDSGMVAKSVKDA